METNKVVKKKTIDMTEGPIMRNVFLFAIPIILGNVLQQLYTTVDTLVIGNFCGNTSLAAVGTSSQPVEVILCLFLGIGTGVSIKISQYIGAKDEESIKSASETAVSFIYMAGIPLSVIGWFLAPYILEFMNVPADTWNAALIYTRVILMGALGNLGYNMNAGILRGMGDSKASLWFLVVSCVVNIALDLILVAGLRMDVQGAAIATTIAMMTSWLVSVFYIKKKFPDLKFTLLPHSFSGSMMKKILAIGLPIGLNNSLYSFGHLALQTFNNANGSIFMAGASVAGRITGLANIAINGLSAAATAFSGQNFGAGKYQRLRKGQWRIPFASGSITLFFGLVIIGVNEILLGFFTKDPMVLMYASRHVIVILLCQWVFAIFNSIISMVNGTGNVKYTTVINLLMLWAVRVPSAYLVSKFYDGTWVMLCYPISFTFGMLCMVGYYLFSSNWKNIMQRVEKS